LGGSADLFFCPANETQIHPMRVGLAQLCIAFTLSGNILADPPAGAKWKPVPEFTDEFDGKSLDLKRWVHGVHNWRGREPGLFVNENVQVADGKLLITSKAEQHPKMDGNYKDYTTAAVSSVNRVRYGYFEIRAKCAAAHVSSAFWFSRNAEEHWTEIDVYEITGKGPQSLKMHMDCHIFKGMGVTKHQQNPVSADLEFDPSADYHTYALEWDVERIRWYCDGKLMRQKPNVYWKFPLHLIMDSEIMEGWFGLPNKEDLPTTYTVDYVRAWQKVP
jgi:beta-glucanase (GH16 family)